MSLYLYTAYSIFTICRCHLFFIFNKVFQLPTTVKRAHTPQFNFSLISYSSHFTWEWTNNLRCFHWPAIDTNMITIKFSIRLKFSADIRYNMPTCLKKMAKQTASFFFYHSAPVITPQTNEEQQSHTLKIINLGHAYEIITIRSSINNSLVLLLIR